VTSPYGLRHLVIISKLSFFLETSSFLVNSTLLRLQIHIYMGSCPKLVVSYPCRTWLFFLYFIKICHIRKIEGWKKHSL
jgi:hypothetical protein